MARIMIKKAYEAGCWAAKFQLFTEKEAPNLPKHLYITKVQAKNLFQYGKRLGIEVFFTPMFPEAVDWCEDIGVKYYKVRYKDNQNKELQCKIVDTNKPFFISFLPFGSGGMIWKRATILNCIPEYPAPLETYKAWGDMLYTHGHGISDHTSDLELLKDTINNRFVKMYIESGYDYYFEKHVKLDDDCIESKWSVTFEDLAEVLK
jgi:sialic acid synthase SpsE